MKKDISCSECRQIIKNKQFFYIDEKPVCYKCLFGDTASVSIYPIGFVKSNTPDKDAVITLHPHQQRFMYSLDEEKEIYKNLPYRNNRRKVIQDIRTKLICQRVGCISGQSCFRY